MLHKYFRCNHENLKKKKYSKNVYVCTNCDKTFITIPAKYDPMVPLNPLNPSLPPQYNNLPDDLNPLPENL